MPVVLVTRVGAAIGSRAAAAALACAASDWDRPALLIDLSGGLRPRSSLVATAAAQDLEERIAAHLPKARVASRGRLCHLSLNAEEEGIEQAGAALSVSPGSMGVVHVAPAQLQPLLAGPTVSPAAALLRADLDRNRALAALAAGGLMKAGLDVSILKSPLGWIASHCAMTGFPACGPSYGLPPRLCARLLDQG